MPSELEMKCLRALVEVLRYDELGFYTPFAPIIKRTGLSRKTVRRSIMALARKGFAEYANGLSDLDGEFRGAGYRPTEKGWTEVKDAE